MSEDNVWCCWVNKSFILYGMVSVGCLVFIMIRVCKICWYGLLIIWLYELFLVFVLEVFVCIWDMCLLFRFILLENDVKSIILEEFLIKILNYYIIILEKNFF